MTLNIKKSTGLEIYLVVEDEGVHSDVDIFDNDTDLLEYLALLTPTANGDTKVYHGVLMPATILPARLDSGRCYITALTLGYKKANLQLEGAVFESDCDGDIDILAEEVKKLLESKSTLNFELDMENIFILYGYELEICLSVNQESRDDEVMDVCKKIATELKKLESDEGD